MGRNKDIRKKIGGYESAIKAHRRKIAEELAKPSPNRYRIEVKWPRDIAVFEREIAKLKRKLPGGKR